MESNYWTRGASSRMTRRSMLRGAALAGAGLGAAALVGCASEEDEATPAPSGTAAPSATTAPDGTAAPTAPSNIPDNALVPSVEGAPKPGGTWVMPTTSTYGQRDMHTALASTPWHNISERAFELDEWTAELRGNAVESWEVVDDQGLELVMKVRPGLVMHDKAPWNGREFNAEDLAFNLERNAGLYAEAEGIPLTSFQRRSMVEGLASAEAVDDHTVRVTMSKPNGALFNGLAEIRTQLMPKGVVELGFDDPTLFASFGAYTCTEFRPGELEVYEKHPNYYRTGEPYFDKYERVVIGDRASILAAFVDRQTSILASPRPHEKDTALQVNKDANYYEWVNTNWDHLRWNTEVPALGDARVRKAFSLATDRADVADGYYGPGWAWSAVGHPDYPEAWSQDQVRALPGFNADTKEADRAEAAALLEAAGYPGGAGIEIVIVPQVTGAFEENALRFQDQMTAIFPDIKIEIQRPSDSTAFATRQAARDFTALSYTITVVPDIFLEWHSQYHSTGSRNYGSFVEATADDLIDRGIAALTQEDRMQIAEEFQTKFVEDWNANLIFNIQPERYLLQGNIGGFDTTAGPWGFTGYRLMNKASRWYEV